MAFDMKSISSAALAYLGDSVIELCTREYLVRIGYSSAKQLNERALEFVRAGAQSEAAARLREELSEAETAVFRRGRNIGHTKTPRSATALQYRQATGLEALFGYLFLEGRRDRIKELFNLAYAGVMENLNLKETNHEQSKNQN